MNDNDRPFALPDFEQSANLAMLLAQTWSFSLEVFLRSRFGSRYIGLQGLLVVPLIFVYALWWPPGQCGDLFLFFVLYLAFCCCRRLGSLWRARRGETGHSRYTGTPLLVRPTGRLTEEAIKQYVEPGLVAVVGCLLGPASAPLATYLVIGAAMMFLTVRQSIHWMGMRTRDLHDSLIEQQMVAADFRSRLGDDC
jgi:hypothetical protein